MNSPCQAFLLILCILIGIMHSGCSPPTIGPSIKNLKPQKIIGTWIADYGDRVLPDKQLKFAIETLIIKNDGAYLQIFDSRNGHKYKSSPNLWYIENGTDGYSVLVFKNFRYFFDGVDAAGNESRLATERRLYPEVVSSRLLGADSRLVLCFSDLDLNLCFERENE